MTTRYILQNSGLPASETMTVDLPDGQNLSTELARAGWSIQSSSPLGSSTAVPKGFDVTALRALLDGVYVRGVVVAHGQPAPSGLPDNTLVFETTN